MIVVVDDDPAVREFLEVALSAGKFDTRIFDGARAALEYLEDHEPDLIISDVIMPEMTGFEFKREYGRRLADRQTPFLFLSSLNDPQTMIEGLEIGASDFLNKPIDAGLLAAKVRSHLRMKGPRSLPVFRGDLAKFPFIKLLQYCESQGLTGSVEVQNDTLDTTVHFRAGVLNETAEGSEDPLEKLLDATSGTFTISTVPPTFADLEDARISSNDILPQSEQDAPVVVGQLSGIEADGRLFQVQTDITQGNTPRIVTIVTLDDRTLMKTSSDPVGNIDRSAIQKMIREQHEATEKRVRSKMEQFVDDPAAGAAAGLAASLEKIIDAALTKYLDRDYAGALALWEEAKAIDPGSKTVAINIEVVKKKLEG